VVSRVNPHFAAGTVEPVMLDKVSSKITSTCRVNWITSTDPIAASADHYFFFGVIAFDEYGLTNAKSAELGYRLFASKPDPQSNSNQPVMVSELATASFDCMEQQRPANR